MAEKISGVYKITNTVTGDFYIGSSNNVKRRWAQHKCPSYLNKHPNNQMYKDMRKYGIDSFDFQILEELEPDKLKKSEQKFIEMLKPIYNNYNANGLNIEKRKKYYQQYRERYNEKRKEYYQQNSKKQKEYYQQNSKKRKEYQNKYNNQPCFYNNETITLTALSTRFKKSGVEHPTREAKKYLVL